MIDFPAAHHSRAGLCAVSTGGVSFFNAADARSSVPVPQDSGREVDSPVSVVQRPAWNCVSVIPSRINARPAAPFSISALFHGANSFAYPFPNPSERIEDAQRQGRLIA